METEAILMKRLKRISDAFRAYEDAANPRYNPDERAARKEMDTEIEIARVPAGGAR